MSSVNDQVAIADVKFSHSLKKHAIVFGLIEKIAEKIKQIPNYESIRLEIELVLTVGNIVENYISKGNKKKVDKKQLVIDALSKVFNYNEQEKSLVGSLIDFLHNNKKIKETSVYHTCKKLCFRLYQSKVNKYVINQVITYILKEHDKLFVLFAIYCVKFKIILFPLIILVIL